MTALAFPRIVAIMFVDAANIGIRPTVTRIAPTDSVRLSACPDSVKKNGGIVTNRSSIDAFVRLPDHIGIPVT